MNHEPKRPQVSDAIINDKPASLLMDAFEIRRRAPLFFMHIPKTAGMSMRLYLSEQYQVDDICPMVSWREILGREQELKSFRLVQGHFRYNLRELVAKDARMLIMLRDPLRRTVSALRHLQRDPSYHFDYNLAKNLTLPEMIRHPELMRNQRNAQARFLCASMSAADDSEYLKRKLLEDPHADAGDLDEPPILKLALDRLESFDFVGLTENIGSIVSAMAKEMNYHPPLYFPFINEDPARADSLRDLTEDDLLILREYNDIDLQIYDYSKRLIERRTFERDMRQLVSSGVYSVPPGSFEIPISGIMPGSGWYAPDQENGLAWRWTGPGRYFTIEVPLRGDMMYRVTMTFGSMRPLGPGDLAAEINDTPIAFELAPEGRGYRCELLIPQELLARSSGFCRIRFDTRETTHPGSPDIRALGVSIRRIMFECLDQRGDVRK